MSGLKRLVALVVVLIIHIVIAIFIVRRRYTVTSERPAAVMSMRSVPMASSLAAQRLPTTSTIFPVAVAAPEFETVDLPKVDALSCDLAAAVGTELGHDPIALSILGIVAADPRRAVMLWDGGWQGRIDADPLRRRIVAVLSGAPPRCLDEVQIGPRLVIIAVDKTSVAIAIGSGSWMWRGLLKNGPTQ
jgi:hypothetical protein